MIEAGNADLYFTVLPTRTNPNTFDFTDEPVLFVPEGDKLVVSGMGMMGIKISNGAGVSLFMQGTIG
jgi:hypothetical protein